MTKTILVTGGAGYIGSTAVKMLLNENYKVVVLDNMTKGVKTLIPSDVPIYVKDTCGWLDEIFLSFKIDAVMHFAAYKSINESMKNPVKYSDNITGLINILNAMVTHGVKKIIFSSSAAVYGIPENDSALHETSMIKPINYYGITKMACEQQLAWYNRIKQIQYISLRYFNVAGDSGIGYIDPAPENIFPLLMETAAGIRPRFTIFGDDYPTRDGTCVRDYIHVTDLIQAHILALNADFNGVINLGSGNGTTIKELIALTEKISGKRVSYDIGKPRIGDPASLITYNETAKKILGWTPKRDISEMLYSTWQSYKS